MLVSGVGAVRLHGGALEIESQEGVGTTVTISLPSCDERKPMISPAMPSGSSALSMDFSIDCSTYLSELTAMPKNFRETSGTSRYMTKNTTTEKMRSPMRPPKNPFPVPNMAPF